MRIVIVAAWLVMVGCSGNASPTNDPDLSTTGDVPDLTEVAPDLALTCTIDAVDYADGAANPANACQTCAVGTSATAWTDLTDGATCGTATIT